MAWETCTAICLCSLGTFPSYYSKAEQTVSLRDFDMHKKQIFMLVLCSRDKFDEFHINQSLLLLLHELFVLPDD
jgi:hypothetical protein